MSERPLSAPAPTLAVQIGSERHILAPTGGPAIIGRDPEAAVRIPDDRISRSHVRLEPHAEGWQAIDTSTNGMYVDGVRRSSVFISGPATIHLGDARGIPVTFTPSAPLEATGMTPVAQMSASTQTVSTTEFSTELEDADPAFARAGRAVAARRRELEITQRSLARDKVINAGTLISFEKGRSWPRRSTLAKLEEVLQWPPGTISRIRSGATPDPDRETTEVVTDSVRAPLMAEAVELAMHTINAAVADLPAVSDPEFTRKITAVLADLRKLESVAANAARNAKGTPSVVLALSTVRRHYHDLMLRAVKSPSATLGQRLYAVRQQADLSVAETANAADLPLEVIMAAEAEREVGPEAAAALENLVAQLSIN
ncbi:FHA domain-containing protein [Mycobacterium sp. 1274756.6]|uniref:FHA domain-containing protein n=1 Tax=Mycobacterium sp. 1274756.6 TaxID=1834076 RepID=UPI0009EE0E89|nr:FHA domain-containing protein [Mycobacterium sp. 1274756.6]